MVVSRGIIPLLFVVSAMTACQSKSLFVMRLQTVGMGFCRPMKNVMMATRMQRMTARQPVVGQSVGTVKHAQTSMPKSPDLKPAMTAMTWQRTNAPMIAKWLDVAMGSCGPGRGEGDEGFEALR